MRRAGGRRVPPRRISRWASVSSLRWYGSDGRGPIIGVGSSLGLVYLDVERLHVGYLDVKTFLFHTEADMETEQQDHIDLFLAELQPVEGLDFVVEGIVDRISGI